MVELGLTNSAAVLAECDFHTEIACNFLTASLIRIQLDTEHDGSIVNFPSFIRQTLIITIVLLTRGRRRSNSTRELMNRKPWTVRLLDC